MVTLSDLPSELIFLTLSAAMAGDVRSPFRFAQTRRVHFRIASELFEVAKRLRWRWTTLWWCPTSTQGNLIQGRTIRSTGDANSWAVAHTLPTSGISQFKFVVEKVASSNTNHIAIGVCNGRGDCSWSIALADGSVDFSKRIVESTPAVERVAGDGLGSLAIGDVDVFGEPPPGFPGAALEGQPVIKALEAFNIEAHEAAKHEVCVVMDHDEGVLSFGVDGGKACVALRSFPTACELRPFAFLGCGNVDDKVSLVPY